MLSIVSSILTKNPCYVQGKKLDNGVKGLVLHSVGCPQPSAMAFIKNWDSPNHKSSCVHAFIDANTGVVYQTLPWDWRGWHCGGNGNNTHIGVEMCEPPCITYVGGSTFTCSDTAKAKEYAKRTYDSAVLLFAALCKQYNLDPTKDGVIISHKEGYKKKLASNHADPEHLWTQLKLGYTMNGFRNDVKKAMEAEVAKKEEEKKDDEALKNVLYRIQCGAFSSKQNANNLLAKVKAAGFVDSYVKFAMNLYKVQIGAYSVKTNAEAMLAKVQAAGFKTAIIAVNEDDTISSSTKTEDLKSLDVIAKEVLLGVWGNGQVRIDNLKNAGYDPDAVQKKVNALVKKK